MNVSFSSSALEAFQERARSDPKIFERINALIKDVGRTPFTGIGKPEPLRHNLAGYWSRRITDEHRLVYKIKDDTIFIASYKDHYY